MTAALGSRASDFAALFVTEGAAAARSSDVAVLSVYVPNDAAGTRASSVAMLTVQSAASSARTSIVAALSVFSTAQPSQPSTTAWTFTMDGHTFYVLDLGNQGTYLFDITTGSWCQFQTANSPGWNFRNGTMWIDGDVPRVIGADSYKPDVYELDPAQLFDEGFRDIAHAATAGVMLRSRVYVSLAELRIAASAGQLDDTEGGAFIALNYSDDGGQTYVGPFVVPLQVGSTPDGQQDIRFSALGSFMAPGRVFQISDVGGILRLDGIDAMMDNYDGDAAEAPASEG